MRSALKPWGQIGAVCAALTLAPFTIIETAFAQDQQEAAPESAHEKQIQDDGHRGGMFRGGRGVGEPRPQAQPAPQSFTPQTDTRPDRDDRGTQGDRGDRGDRDNRDNRGDRGTRGNQDNADRDNGGTNDNTDLGRSRDNIQKPGAQTPQGLFNRQRNRWTDSDTDNTPRRPPDNNTAPDNTNRRKDEPRRNADRDNNDRNDGNRNRWNNDRNDNGRNDNWRDDNRRDDGRNRNDWMRRDGDRDRERAYARYRDPNHRWRGSRPRIIIQNVYTLPPAYYNLRPMWAGPLYDEELWSTFEPAVYDALPYGARERHEQAFQYALYGPLNKTQSWWYGDARGDITMFDEWYFGDEWCRDFMQSITTSTWKRTVDGRMCIDRGEPWRLVAY